MNNGRIENFERPYNLIMDETSILYEMLNSLDKMEKERLIEMAKRSGLSSNSFTSSTLSPNTSSTSSKLLHSSSSPITSDPDPDLSLDDAEKQNLIPKIL